jgi:hypothetical protein
MEPLEHWIFIFSFSFLNFDTLNVALMPHMPTYIEHRWDCGRLWFLIPYSKHLPCLSCFNFVIIHFWLHWKFWVYFRGFNLVIISRVGSRGV